MHETLSLIFSSEKEGRRGKEGKKGARFEIVSTGNFPPYCKFRMASREYVSGFS
jgi:hypothetical protein